MKDISINQVDQITERYNYRMEGDDRTFRDRETSKGIWLDGYKQCYEDVMEIINKGGNQK